MALAAAAADGTAVAVAAAACSRVLECAYAVVLDEFMDCRWVLGTMEALSRITTCSSSSSNSSSTTSSVDRKINKARDCSNVQCCQMRGLFLCRTQSLPSALKGRASLVHLSTGHVDEAACAYTCSQQHCFPVARSLVVPHNLFLLVVLLSPAVWSMDSPLSGSPHSHTPLPCCHLRPPPPPGIR